MILVFESSPNLGCVFYSLKSPIIRSDWRKSEKMFHAIQQLRWQLIYNCHNILSYHTVGCMQTYWKWRRVTESDCCNICAASAEWRPLTLPTLGAVICNIYSYCHVWRKLGGYCLNSGRIQAVLDCFTKRKFQICEFQKQELCDHCTNSDWNCLEQALPTWK